jgi:hypothetical protein
MKKNVKLFFLKKKVNEWAQSLANPIFLKEWYLNPEFAHTKETVNFNFFHLPDGQS